jgi:XTP/dITP diphosphohydrolase
MVLKESDIMKPEVYLITRNAWKLRAARNAFSKFKIGLKQITKEYPEIQADSSIEVARHTAAEAVKEFGVPVVREDHSLFIKALGGFPGPYTNYFDRTIPAELLLKMMSSFKDRSAYMELSAALALPSGEMFDFVHRIPLKISESAKGSIGNWDKILMLKDDKETFAEVDEELRVDQWSKNYEKIAKKMLKLADY